MPYIYNDEDNAPMNEDAFSGFHNPTVYSDRSEMNAIENAIASVIPFTYEKPDDGCWNCLNYDPSRGACTIRWNNLDNSYYDPDLDDREPTDCCEDHDPDNDADPEDWFGGDER